MGTDSCQRNSLKRTREQIGFQHSDGSGSKGSLNGTVKDALNLKLKRDLQEKIQSQRAAKGLGEIKVDFNPKSPEPLSEQERKKEEHRKESNRQSADRCRKKVKEENAKNEKSLKEETERNKELLKRLRQLEVEREELLEQLKNNGLILNEIADQLQAGDSINDTNRIFGPTTAERLKEDQESVCNLQNSENNSDTNTPSPEPKNVSVIRYNGSHFQQTFMNGHESDLETEVTKIRSDVMTGNDAMNHEWETDSSSFSSNDVQLEVRKTGMNEYEHDFNGENSEVAENFQFQIIEADSFENGSDVNDDGNVVIYICFGEEAYEEVTYENVEPGTVIANQPVQI